MSAPTQHKALDEALVKQFRGEIAAALSPFQEFMKLHAGPASKATGVGVENIMKALAGPNHSTYFDQHGIPRIVPHQGLKGKRVGYREKRNPETGHREQGGYFGDFLKTLYTYRNQDENPAARGEAREKLVSWGVSGVVKDRQGHVVSKAALAESSGVTGGYTVPPMFAETLLTLALEPTVLPKLCTTMPLTSRTLLVPSLDITTANGAGVSNFLGGLQAYWTAEAALRQEYEPQFRQTELTAWELSFISIASNTLLQDEAVGLDQFLTQYFGLAIAWFSEYAMFQGNGVGKPLGILNAPATIAVTREIAGTFTYIDATNLFAQLWTMLQDEKSVAWFIHPSVYPRLLRMNDESGGTAGTHNQGRMLFVPINQGAQAGPDRPDGPTSVGTLFGKPVYQTEKLPALGTSGCVLLADCSKYLIGQRMELEIDVSPHYRFANNQLTWRIVARLDGQPWLNDAVTLADGVKEVSPFLYLTQ